MKGTEEISMYSKGGHAMGKEYLVEGAMLMCLNGTNPTTLKVPGGH